MKDRSTIDIGDPVEIRMIERPSPSRVTRDAVPSPALRPEPREIWVPATVVAVSEQDIRVAFSDGERLALVRYSHAWRPA